MNGSWPALLVRADDRPEVGAGHVMRTLALVERWSRSGPALVALGSHGSPLAERVRRAGGDVVVAGTTRDDAGLGALVDAHRPAWVVLDGYRFGTEVQSQIRSLGPRLAVVDDHGHHGSYDADVVVDQNLGDPSRGAVLRPDGAAALLGPRYALVREEFRSVSSVLDDASRPTIVVTLGGYAAERAEQVADDLADDLAHCLADRDIVATVTTPARAGSTEAMARLLAGATVVVSAAGSTSWELCALGRPSLLVAVADNQEPVGAALADAGAARYLGVLDDVERADLAGAVTDLVTDAGARAGLARRADALVDGLGADRVTTELRSSLIDLRPVQDQDRRLVWEWANDPEVRSSAWSTEPISWEDHVRWWDTPPTHPRHHFVAEHDGVPWGQVRFDEDGRAVAEVDVSVAAGCRGRHASGPLIRAAVRRLFHDTSCTTVRASVRGDNTRSIQAFLAADFTLWPEASPVEGCTLTYIRGRDGRH